MVVSVVTTAMVEVEAVAADIFGMSTRPTSLSTVSGTVALLVSPATLPIRSGGVMEEMGIPDDDAATYAAGLAELPRCEFTSQLCVADVTTLCFGTRRSVR
jgi:hypothetical protein